MDWLGSKLSIRRGIVERVVDVKTAGSARTFDISSELLERLRIRKRDLEFSEPGNRIFASPYKLGRLPYSYTRICLELQAAAKAAGIGNIGTHAFRHTYRSWLDAVGAPIAVQQKMMQHADTRTTLNIYGDVLRDEMTTAGIKVAQLAFRGIGAQTERRAG